ncbi:MAG: hypothetical protein M3Q27_01640 [Actinomycetota bacterium]|nr:hypothetical protein [Actinomycetota bacterium]
MERCFATRSPGPARLRAESRGLLGRAGRLTRIGLVAMLGCAIAFLLLAGVAVAALALAMATAVVWVFWRLCLRHADEPTSPPSVGPADVPGVGTERRFGASIRRPQAARGSGVMMVPVVLWEPFQGIPAAGPAAPTAAHGG